MSAGVVDVRSSTEVDRDAIWEVHLNAFGAEEGPVIVELVRELLQDETASPLHSLVAESDTGIVGHVLFTAVTLDRDQGVAASILAPLAVTPPMHGQGVGRTLVEKGLRQLEAAGVELVFVLGYPGYYTRFGFQPAGAQGFDAPYPIADQNADAWMVKGLTDKAMESHAGTVRCAKSLDDEKLWVE